MPGGMVLVIWLHFDVLHSPVLHIPLFLFFAASEPTEDLINNGCPLRAAVSAVIVQLAETKPGSCF